MSGEIEGVMRAWLIERGEEQEFVALMQSGEHVGKFLDTCPSDMYVCTPITLPYTVETTKDPRGAHE